ncbi:hypothetical protein [uncultured Ellagibacter sp.]|uniref:beta strand repeat-containing protein n=1 Tax=uncultured Ellagibacter sp. TaxID=2137580 RepID=UPI00262A0F76|nr:hypothetical protein [uncultured Ellagibacter sp.]
MKASNANKVISVLLSVAMCPMMVPSAAFAADDGSASDASSAAEQAQVANQAEGVDAGASSSDTIAPQSEATGEAAGEAAAPAAAANGEGAEDAPSEEGTEAAVAEVNGTSYPSLQAAIDAAPRKATVKLLADTKENVTISTPYVTLNLNGHTLNGGTEKGKPALTVTARVTVMDSSEAQTGIIMREDTAENSGVSSHYVIDVQGDGWLTFESGNVTNGSGAGGTKGASLVRVGDDSIAKYPGLNIKGGTFTQDNFIVIKVDRGDLFLNGGTLNSTNSYAIEDWFRATIKGGTVNGAVAAWTYSDGSNSDLSISGGTINGNVFSVNYGSAEGKVAKVSITGGAVNGTLGTYTYNNGLTATTDAAKATIAVTGGTFSNDPTKYVVEDSAINKNDDGTFGVAKAYLAQVGETSYYTMDEAFEAQTTSGETITLLRDYTTGSTFNSGSVARVVDLNGHTWTCTGTDANSAAFEINYSDASLTVKNGKIVSSQLIGLIPSAMGGTITYDNSTLMFEGVEATTTATSGIQTNGSNANDTVVLKDSTLNVPNGFGIYFPSSGTLTIDNSKINAKTMGVQVCSGNLNVTAGSAITVSGDPVEKTEGDGAIQDGAAISIVNRAGYKGLGQTAITGGTFTAKAGNAALKAYTWDSSTKQELAFDNSAKAVAVSGGTFSAAVASDLCAEGYAPVANADGTYSVGAPVAQIGTKAYASLADAVAAAEDGQTVTLLADVEQNTQLTIDKDITLDLNGKTIKNTQDIWGDNANAILSITNGAKVTITGNGTIDAKENDCYTINVVKGDLTIENGTFYGNVSVVQVQEGTLSVKGGTFDLHQKWEGSSKYLFNCIDDAYANGSANVAISGGTFVGFDLNVSPEGEGTSYLAPGYAPVDNGDGTYGVVAGVAQIGTKAYTNLQAAIDAAQAGDTVQLLADTTENVTISANDVTLDLNGHTLNGSTGERKPALTVTSKVTIVDSSEAQTGTIMREDTAANSGVSSHYVIDVQGEGDLLFESGIVKNGSGAGGTKGASLVRIGTDSKPDALPTMTVAGGTFTQDNFIALKVDYGTLYVKGGTINSANSYAVQNWKSASIEGGTVNGNISTWTYSGGPGAELTISGGTVNGDIESLTYDGVAGNPAKVAITGGTVNGSLYAIDYSTSTTTDDPTKATIDVAGGTFSNEVPVNYCAEGYAPTSNANGTYGVKLAEGAYLLQDYRSGDQASWTYPTQEGMAFAGWYKDAAFTTPCTASDVEGAAYAKFVNITDLLQYKGGSLRMDVAQPSELTWLRFGYTMALPEGASFVENGWYFKKVSTSQPTDVRKLANNNVLNIDGTITANLVFTGVTTNYYSANFSEKAFVKYVTADGTTVEAVESDYQVRSVLDVADVILAHPMASKAEKDYATQIKAAV